ncbi:MAG: nucleoside deaminase [Alphaproteobacteria bacterium]|nr:nucleoside deaminase [Alphaproteobacteria bacterium]
MNNDLLSIAVKYAKEAASQGGYPFGAVVTNDGKIIGDSRRRTITFGALNHAEINAIINACENTKKNDLTGCVIYSSCQPCELCMGAIKWIGIREVHYAMDMADAKSAGLEEVFAPDFARITEHKILNEDLIAFMKKWYDAKV